MKFVFAATDQIGKWADGVSKAVETASLKAINRTAFEIRDAEYAGMRQHFDRPVPRTLRSLFIDFAKPGRAEATVRVADSFSGVPPVRYLNPQVYGGERAMKSHEKKLGAMTSPVNAPRDKYGNVPGSFYVKVLSQLSLMSDATQNASNSSRSRAKRKRESFFIAGDAVMSRKAGQEPTVQLVLLKQPLRYQPRLPFYEISQETFTKVFEQKFWSEYSKARGG